MSKPDLVVAGTSFKTRGIMPNWTWMRLVKAEREKDEETMSDTIVEFVERILVPDELPRYREFFDLYEPEDEDNNAEIFVKMFDGIVAYAQEVSSNPKASTK